MILLRMKDECWKKTQYGKDKRPTPFKPPPKEGVNTAHGETPARSTMGVPAGSKHHKKVNYAVRKDMCEWRVV